MTLEYIKALPKTDLHCHLDGSLRIETILDLAKKQQIALPSHNPKELFEHVYAGPQCASLVDYLKGFDVTLSVLQTEDALFRVAYELAQDCAHENVRYVEVRYAPILHTQKDLSLQAIVEAVLAGLAAGERDFGIISRVILCGMRSMDPQLALQTAQLCVQYQEQGVVAFDLAGAELGYPPSLHKQALALIQENNISCTIHAGEADGPSSIANALHHGAHRIGHGTRLQEDPGLLRYVRDHQIPLEVCVSSNVQTKAVPTLASHPLASYLQQGLCVTLNTDNRLITHTTATQELALCHTQYGMERNQLQQLILNGFRSAFLPWPHKQTMLQQVQQEFASLDVA